MNGRFSFGSAARWHRGVNLHRIEGLVMKPFVRPFALIVAALSSLPAGAASHEAQLAAYASAARATSPAFAGFSAERGKALHLRHFAGGKPDTPACATCHGTDPRAAGRTPAGKVVEAMAVSISPARYTDPAKVEKWFRRNCNEVLGRECTPLEKGDWLTFVLGQ
jgi:hypothetical protein